MRNFHLSPGKNLQNTKTSISFPKQLLQFSCQILKQTCRELPVKNVGTEQSRSNWTGTLCCELNSPGNEHCLRSLLARDRWQVLWEGLFLLQPSEFTVRALYTAFDFYLLNKTDVSGYPSWKARESLRVCFANYDTQTITVFSKVSLGFFRYFPPS